MASELIRAVLAAEQECKENEAAAKTAAEQKKAQAKSDSSKIIADAEKQVQEMLANDEKAISKSAAQKLEKEKAACQKECQEISKKAAGNLDSVIKKAISAMIP